MYRQHFGLLHKPFELIPDAGTLFLSESHKEALSVLRYGVVANKGFLVLTGGIGTGKTTLVNVLAASLDCPHHLCVLSNPTLEIADFYYYLALKLGLPFDGNKAKFLILFSQLTTPGSTSSFAWNGPGRSEGSCLRKRRWTSFTGRRGAIPG
ncbi:hypothetical protein JT06_00415 [Desulfobulbus sp. Tol-SR]|nr:hypothetical protein JT06_00415 [Desulfobulbus sp. Tol-SR]